MGMGGVQRASKTAKYLAQMGWNIYVLTADYRSFPVTDLSLKDDLPDSIHITRIADPLSYNSIGGEASSFVNPAKSGFLQRLIRIPDARIFWANKIKETAEKLTRDNDIQYLLTTAPPPSVHMVGSELRKKYKLRWLADFRDPWAADDSPALTPIHAMVQNKLEQKIIGNADQVSVVTISHQHDLQRRYPEFKNKIYYIPNGFDPDDFTANPNPPRDKMLITHCGTMCSQFSVVAFFEALKRVLIENSALKDKTEFVQIGNVDKGIFQDLEKNYTQYVNINYKGYLDHSSAIKMTLDSSAVIVFSGISPTLELNLPGKLYEALASKLPVLAVFKKTSPARDILSGLPEVYLLDPDDIDESAVILKDFIERNLRDEIKPVDRSGLISRYSRKFQAEQMAALLENN